MVVTSVAQLTNGIDKGDLALYVGAPIFLLWSM